MRERPNEEGEIKISSEIATFVNHVSAIYYVMGGLVPTIEALKGKANENLKDIENNKLEKRSENGEEKMYVPQIYYREWRDAVSANAHFKLAGKLLPRSLLVSLISQYDAYIGRLLRSILIKRPEILNSSEKKFSFEQLFQFDSIELAREHILEKEIESILRSSHSEQIKSIEKMLEIPLTKGLDVWPQFIEATERRNLFVHTNGFVSSQYLSVCKAHKYAIDPDVKEGSLLEIDLDYFELAKNCIIEIGIKLGHVVWRKILENEIEESDDSLIEVSYEMIIAEDYSIAEKILDFACDTLKKHSSEHKKLVLVINRAQCYKWNGKKDACEKILASIDWSAKGDEFKISNAVLTENWGSAVKIMKRIGKSGPISKFFYKEWPLFKEFRHQPCFIEAYKEIFEEEFSAQESEVE